MVYQQIELEYLNDIRLGQLVQYKLDTSGKDKLKEVESKWYKENTLNFHQ